MTKKTFSFVTITYNHQNYILNHLESIKYQIQNFGENLNFELIIGDDSSTDKTIQLVNKWLDSNKSLFEKVVIDVSSQNQGIVNNFLKSLKLFNGDFFKVLAGDDMYSCSNLFDCFNLLDHFDIIQGAVLEFEDDKIKNEIEFFEYIKEFHSVKVDSLKRYAMFNRYIFRAPGFIFRKELITAEMIKFISEFKMCEDKPLFYMLLKNRDVKIKFHPTPIVLYRISNSSIARNANHNSKTILVNDDIILNKMLSENISLPFSNGYFKYFHYSLNNSLKSYLFKFNPIVLFYKLSSLSRSIIYHKEVIEYYKSIQPSIQENQKHIDLIKNDNNLLDIHN